MKILRTLIAATAALAAANAFAASKVVVYNWSEYIPEDVVTQFTEETGIEVVYSTYESNEVMYSKLQLQKNKGYDVVVPSTYYVAKMAKEGMLQKLDPAKLSNKSNLDPQLLNKEYDPNNQYSMPYFWGSTGIGVNSEEMDVATIDSWAQLWDPKYKKQLLLTDDVREVFHMALVLNGHSPNTTNPEEIKQAYERLQSLMPNVLVFNSDAPREPYLAGDVALGMIWNGEVMLAQEEDDSLKYVYPKEGAVFWVDNFVIPAGAENVDEAHAFINFMMRPDIAQACVEYVGYATANKAALELLDEETRTNPVIFPPAEIIEQGVFQTDVGEAMELYNQYWEKLKVGQ
ncbi:extracellular solute-binding protein [Pseudoalteromonas pernae]|uniref:extracellular solute-binding protein n=1 Tax=Pseudoalteromonas pernae TaxID=3118054 RepID=UPI0032421FFF